MNQESNADDKIERKSDGWIDVTSPLSKRQFALTSLSIALAAGLVGFGATLLLARERHSPTTKKKKKTTTTTTTKKPKIKPGSFSAGLRLGFKALGYATVISVTGVSVFTLLTAKALGVSSFEEFGKRMRRTVPDTTNKINKGMVRPVKDTLQNIADVLPKSIKVSKKDENKQGEKIDVDPLEVAKAVARFVEPLIPEDRKEKPKSGRK